MIIDRDNNEIVLLDNGTIIEKYNFEKEINFEGLTKNLLKRNLFDKIDIIDNTQEKEQKEENLIKLIEEIINNYNIKVEEYEKFVKELES